MLIQLKIILLFLSLLPGSPATHYHNYNEDLKSLIEKNNIDTNNLTVLIDKSDYKLSIMCDTAIVKEYPVVFGKNPIDDKLMQGDCCTPEGIFFMRMKYPHSKWSKFIWLNYPTGDSWVKHNAAIRQGLIPVNAAIGGEIGIHGVPVDYDFLIDIHYNWTAGCISLKTKDINEIYPYITTSTPITIQQ